ncbi:uncharacterized protein ARMOST_08507 [Armillaria ostoyae]|uniref:Uncharacterized protein n=1 Tax=Armillaria ostoyae TaxID=47428 RepID=A0A284R8U5_ARMOS|nr:uncharacterized protein ARMOST_08507 [Armillaria ostoyae]
MDSLTLRQDSCTRRYTSRSLCRFQPTVAKKRLRTLHSCRLHLSIDTWNQDVGQRLQMPFMSSDAVYPQSPSVMLDIELVARVFIGNQSRDIAAFHEKLNLIIMI